PTPPPPTHPLFPYTTLFRSVHHQPNRQHQAKERKRIDGETDQRENDERAHQRDRYSQQRNQRGAPALQEDIDNQDHKPEGDQERDRKSTRLNSSHVAISYAV